MKNKLSLLILFSCLGLVTQQSSAQSRNGSPNMRLEATGLGIGSSLDSSLEVYGSDGVKMKVTDLFKNKPTVIVSGCLTCPVFLRTYAGVEAVYQDYKEKVNFYYLYKTLAHPENHGYIQPITIDERLLHISEAKEKLQTKIPWLADPMTNEVSSAFGLTPNSEFLFDTKGKIFYMNAWSNAEDLRNALVELVGAVSDISTIASLNLPAVSPMSTPLAEVTTRVTVDENLIPVIVQPEDNNGTYYVKLRAEVTSDLLSKGSGKLYLGFHLDPIHNVHWNNLVDPLKYEITVPQVTRIEKAKGMAPFITQPSDIEPREFFIEVENWKSGGPLPIEIIYYACDENDKWCKIVVQNYTLVLDRDPFAGGVIGRSFRAGRGGQSMRTGSRGGRSMGQGFNMVERMMSFDKNKDGLLSKEEVPERMKMRFDAMDTNKDGFLSKDELSNMRRL